MDKQKLIFFGPFSTPHTESWSELIDLKKYNPVGISVHRGPSKMKVFSSGHGLGKFRFLLAILMLGVYCLRHPKALVLSHYYSSYGLASLLAPLQPVIFCWGSDVNVLNTNYPRFAKIIGWLANTRAKVLIVPSISIKKKLVDDGVSEDKIKILQYGIDVEKIQAHINNIYSVDESVNVASIRNGDDLYQINKIIDAFKLADFGNKAATLHIFGSGHSIQNDYSDVGFQKKIVNHGFLDKEKFYQVMKSCDIFISIPTRDGLSLSVLEALYLGLEPILSDVGSYKELFAEVNPYLVNADVTAKALGYLISTVVSDIYSLDENQRPLNRFRLKKFVEGKFSKVDAKNSLAFILAEILDRDFRL